MTDDEMLYGASETVEQLHEYERLLGLRHHGKIVKAYGSKTFQVDGVEYKHGHLSLVGFVLKVDGTCGVRRYSQHILDAEFVKP